MIAIRWRSSPRGLIPRDDEVQPGDVGILVPANRRIFAKFVGLLLAASMVGLPLFVRKSPRSLKSAVIYDVFSF